MPYSLHFVPGRYTREVLLSVAPTGSLRAPTNQRIWANPARMQRDLAPILGPREWKEVSQSIAAGRACLLRRVSLSDAELDRLGL